MKKCSRCKEVKELSEFYRDKARKGGRTSHCKSCQKQYEADNKDKKRLYNQARREIKAEYNKQYYQDNKEHIIAYQKQYNQENAERIKHRQKAYNEAYKPRRNLLAQERKAADPVYKLRCQMSTLISQAFTDQVGHRRTGQRTENIIGCSFDELQMHLYRTFESNYGIPYDGSQRVHIDHIIPTSTARTVEEVLTLNHYSNLQLLLAVDNISKSNRLDYGAPKHGKKVEE